MSTNKVNIKTAIQRGMDSMGMDDDSSFPILLDFAVEAEKAIGSKEQFLSKICVIDIEECRAKAPCGLVKIEGLLLGDHGCDCNLLFNQAFNIITSEVTFESNTGIIVIDASTNQFRCSSASYELQAGFIVFRSNFDEGKATIKYLSMILDEDGFPMINEGHIRAISQYLEWRMARRKRWKGKKIFTINEVRDMEKEWTRLCSDARGDDGDPNDSQIAEISADWHDGLPGHNLNFPDNNYF